MQTAAHPAGQAEAGLALYFLATAGLQKRVMDAALPALLSLVQVRVEHGLTHCSVIAAHSGMHVSRLAAGRLMLALWLAGACQPYGARCSR